MPLTDRPIERPTNKPIDLPTDRLNKPTDRLTDRPAYRRAIDRLTIDQSIKKNANYFIHITLYYNKTLNFFTAANMTLINLKLFLKNRRQCTK